MAEEQNNPPQNEGQDTGSTTGTPPPDQNKGPAPAGSKPGLIPIVVNGKSLMLSQEELIARAQKVEAAEEKSRKASEAIRLVEDLDLAERGDEAAFRRVAAHRKWAPEKVEQMLAQRREAAIRAQVESVTGKSRSAPAAAAAEDDDDSEVSVDTITEAVVRKLAPYLEQFRAPVTVDRLDPRLQRAIVKNMDTAIHQDIGAVIDKDPVLGNLRKYGSPEQREELQALIEAEGVRRANAGADLTNPRTISDVLQAVRSTVARLGIRPAQVPVPLPGLGPTASGSGDLYQGTEPPKRPKGGIFDPSYGDWMARMLAHDMVKQAEEE